MPTHVPTCVHMCSHVFTCAHMCAHVFTFVHMCSHVHTCAHISIRVHTTKQRKRKRERNIAASFVLASNGSGQRVASQRQPLCVVSCDGRSHEVQWGGMIVGKNRSISIQRMQHVILHRIPFCSHVHTCPRVLTCPHTCPQMSTRTHTCPNVSTQVHRCAHMCTHVRTNAHMCQHAHICQAHACTWAHMSTHGMSTHAHTCPHMCTHVHTWLCEHVRTHATQAPTLHSSSKKHGSLLQTWHESLRVQCGSFTFIAGCSC